MQLPAATVDRSQDDGAARRVRASNRDELTVSESHSAQETLKREINRAPFDAVGGAAQLAVRAEGDPAAIAANLCFECGRAWAGMGCNFGGGARSVRWK